MAVQVAIVKTNSYYMDRHTHINEGLQEVQLHTEVLYFL